MTTPHRTLREAAQMALDALQAATTPLAEDRQKVLRAITALREALSAPEPEPVALESVHLTRDTRGMCVVRVNGRVAIQDNGDIIDHMATLEWFAAPPAAPDSQWMPIETAPKDVTILLYGAKRLEMCVGMHHSRDGWVTDTTSEWMSMYPPTHWMPLPAAPDHLRDVAEKAAPAAPVVPLTDEQIRSMWLSSEFRGNGGQVDWFCEGIRAAEAHHGITGASK